MVGALLIQQGFSCCALWCVNTCVEIMRFYSTCKRNRSCSEKTYSIRSFWWYYLHELFIPEHNSRYWSSRMKSIGCHPISESHNLPWSHFQAGDASKTQLCGTQTSAASLKNPADGSCHTVFLEYLIFFHKPTHFAVPVIICIITQTREVLYKQLLLTFPLPTLNPTENTQASNF